MFDSIRSGAIRISFIIGESNMAAKAKKKVAPKKAVKKVAKKAVKKAAKKK